MYHQELDQLSEERLEALLLQGTLPRHVAIIMDGNGRWASQRGLPRIAGHREGGKSAREAVMTCRKFGISAVTLYAFSSENWRRPQSEIDMLMELLCEYVQSEKDRFLREKICFRAIGRLDRLPMRVQTLIRELESATHGHDQMTLVLALSYGGRDEILDAVNRIMQDASRGLVPDRMIDETLFVKYLDTSGLPDPDLLIRTSGECRVSNFLLWQIAYTELYFSQKLWPDFRRREMILALLDYQRRERRLGGLAPLKTSDMNEERDESQIASPDEVTPGYEHSVVKREPVQA